MAEASPLSPSQEQPAKKAGAGSILAPLRVRDYRLLFSGQLISTIGDAFYAVALPWLVLTNGGNAQELGIILSAYGIPRIGSVLLGGVLSDRLRPRRVMLLADGVRAVLVGILAMLALVPACQFDRFRYWRSDSRYVAIWDSAGNRCDLICSLGALAGAYSREVPSHPAGGFSGTASRTCR